MRSREELEIAVHRGALALDRWNEHWRELIDPEALDMASGSYDSVAGVCGCVLAQVDYREETEFSGTYIGGLRLLISIRPDQDYSEAIEWEVAHGFEAHRSEEYPELTELWKKEILDPSY